MLQWKRIPVHFQFDPVWYRCSSGCGTFVANFTGAWSWIYPNFLVAAVILVLPITCLCDLTPTQHSELHIYSRADKDKQKYSYSWTIQNSQFLHFFGLWEKAWLSQTRYSCPSQLQHCVLCGRWLIEDYNQCIHYIGCIGNCTTNRRMKALWLVVCPIVCKGSFVCAFINLSANLICWFCWKLQFNTSHSRWIINVLPRFSIKHSDCIPTFNLSLSLPLPLSLWPCHKKTLTHSGQNRTVSDMV